jgi:hypothetical protein
MIAATSSRGTPGFINCLVASARNGSGLKGVMMTGTVDMDGYAEIVTGYVLRRVDEESIELDSNTRDDMRSYIYKGLTKAMDSGGEHWELAFRGAVEVMLERMTFISRTDFSNPDVLVPVHPPGSDLLREEEEMLSNLGSTLPFSGPISFFRICPLWPFC